MGILTLSRIDFVEVGLHPPQVHRIMVRNMTMPLVFILFWVTAGTDAADYQKARQAMVAGRYDQAVPVFVKLWAEHPEITEYGLLLADGLLHLDQRDPAKTVLADMASRPLNAWEDAVFLVELLAITGQWAEAVTVLEPIAASKPGQDQYAVHYWLGKAHSALGSWSKAGQALTLAVAIRPESGMDWETLGGIHLRAGRFALAAQALLRAARNGIDSVELHLGLARAFYEVGNYLGDVKVLNIPGGQIGSVGREGYIFAKAGDGGFHVCPMESAVHQAAETLAADPDSVNGRLILGNIWLRVGRYADALTEYARIEGKLPVGQMAKFSYHRALAYLGIEDYENYLAQIRQAALIAPDDYEAEIAKAYAGVAERHAQRGDLTEYIRFLEFARKADPEEPEYHRLLGFAYSEAKDLARAVESWRIVLELNTNHPQRAELVDLIQQAADQATKANN
jgi:tetratricopeptide (TPR) repeat protein